MVADGWGVLMMVVVVVVVIVVVVIVMVVVVPTYSGRRGWEGGHYGL